MAAITKNLIPAKYAEIVQTTQYTANNCKAVVNNFTATNISAGNVTLTINVVSPSGTAAADNRVIPARAIAPGECWTAPGMVGQVLEPGGFISTVASVASAIVIRASGVEIVS